ncbi:NUDIX hydrolase [bacterium]|nr:MAG: NUDIX hydrolase [bacterium]
MKTYTRNWFQSSQVNNEHRNLKTHQVWSWIISNDSKVLIVDDKTKFNFPGGTVDNTETNLQTLERELYEEIGMEKEMFNLTEKYQFGYYVIEQFDENKLVDEYLQVRFLLRLDKSSLDYDFKPTETGALAILSCKFVGFEELTNYFSWLQDSGEYKFIKNHFFN